MSSQIILSCFKDLQVLFVILLITTYIMSMRSVRNFKYGLLYPKEQSYHVTVGKGYPVVEPSKKGQNVNYYITDLEQPVFLRSEFISLVSMNLIYEKRSEFIERDDLMN
ncbi:hypothetical protein N42HA_00252 [Lactococcus lactis]|nr:hypothetical protein [Lactococcus lactis]